MQDQTVIVGDIGGTSVRFALVQLEDGKMRLSKTWKDTDPTISSFDEAFEHFVSFAGLFADASTTPDAAVFAIAGPIAAKGHVKLTNREWPEFHPESLMNRYGITDFRAVNDFTAMARGVAEAPADCFTEVLAGTPMDGKPILITGPGTGFGISTLQKVRGRWHVTPGEGGHASYGPRTDEELTLLQALQKTSPYVSNEAVVAGIGLLPVYRAVCEMNGAAPDPEMDFKTLADLAEKGDVIACQVYRLRANALMGSIGDAALISGARGGVIMTGSVARHMAPWLKAEDAVARFRERGIMSGFLTDVPVSVLESDDTALFGAAALWFDDQDA